MKYSIKSKSNQPDGAVSVSVGHSGFTKIDEKEFRKMKLRLAAWPLALASMLVPSTELGLAQGTICTGPLNITSGVTATTALRTLKEKQLSAYAFEGKGATPSTPRELTFEANVTGRYLSDTVTLDTNSLSVQIANATAASACALDIKGFTNTMVFQPQPGNPGRLIAKGSVTLIAGQVARGLSRGQVYSCPVTFNLSPTNTVKDVTNNNCTPRQLTQPLPSITLDLKWFRP